MLSLLMNEKKDKSMVFHRGCRKIVSSKSYKGSDYHEKS